MVTSDCGKKHHLEVTWYEFLDFYMMSMINTFMQKKITKESI